MYLNLKTAALERRYLGAVWGLVEAAMDGITFWGPLLIRKILDPDTDSTGQMGVHLLLRYTCIILRSASVLVEGPRTDLFIDT
jgi:hypothetical protein